MQLYIRTTMQWWTYLWVCSSVAWGTSQWVHSSPPRSGGGISPVLVSHISTVRYDSSIVNNYDYCMPTLYRNVGLQSLAGGLHSDWSNWLFNLASADYGYKLQRTGATIITTIQRWTIELQMINIMNMKLTVVLVLFSVTRCRNKLWSCDLSERLFLVPEIIDVTHRFHLNPL